MVMGAALFITEERAQVVDFSAPIYGWGEGVVIRDGDEKHYGSLADFKGAKVGTLVDSVQYMMIEALPGTDVHLSRLLLAARRCARGPHRSRRGRR
ncbi:transporter substrate-binding domain-containing protein [Caballeronia sp. LZ029]|uniref:transporter substrate-binding domain-containing protein n=1 Tax=Caballeronia sp. LZ029 TaxID=3038564 RepID=UPI00285CB2E5|nr:transporter substrate-binding domain-containing protein [Caballeronia sp. LZ029]MDR5748323.1 transporter substrate-binding domain-containing protein [Caballeronia sp. LZ029]